EEIVGTSQALQPVLARVAKVARSDTTVLILGETGTGKELVARAIHRRAPREGPPVVSGNWGAGPARPLASAQFGPREEGGVGGDAAPPWAVRARPRRDHLPRRSRRAADGDAGGTPPRAAGTRVRAGRGERRDSRGCPRDRRHQSRPGGDGRSRDVPKRFVLS